MTSRVRCGQNLKTLSSAMLAYAQDNGGRFPTPETWCDLLLEGGYASDEEFRCPSNRKQRCSYAMNPDTGPDSDSDTVLLFETSGGWNRFGGRELACVDNHQGDGCHVAFVDTHVEFLRTLDGLKWKQ